jgi:hypothetical protein
MNHMWAWNELKEWDNKAIVASEQGYATREMTYNHYYIELEKVLMPPSNNDAKLFLLAMMEPGN